MFLFTRHWAIHTNSSSDRKTCTSPPRFVIACSFPTTSSKFSSIALIYMYPYLSNQTLDRLFLSKSPDFCSSVYRICPTRKELQQPITAIRSSHGRFITRIHSRVSKTPIRSVLTTFFQTVVNEKEKNGRN